MEFGFMSKHSTKGKYQDSRVNTQPKDTYQDSRVNTQPKIRKHE